MIFNDQNLIPSCGLPVGSVCPWCLPNGDKIRINEFIEKMGLKPLSST
ncbi:hypothetical protein PLAN_40094 [Planktothrix rubescens CCAP 1459/22]|uniref:Uncharacterized protein n=1 Tax=Planktothrix rubescens CCAP 1459/22 TaxID=329571 RepID=A0A6J7ZMZ6_PLARU|nr:hypothetical protein PLAN_40094 [Planktothrix rubescens NIVA-CYA 18]CAD0225365.1 conserved hypothetical protein [Planktothrix agardhii]